MRRKKKNKPGQGRKLEGRVRGHLFMHPDAWGELDSRKSGSGDTRGKVVERLLGRGT